MRPQIRSLLLSIAPPWLLDDNGRRMLYTIGVGLDGVLDWAKRGVLSRFATTAPTEALPFIGRDRRIVRGFDEPEADFRTRLKGWLRAWHRAGHAFGICEAVAGYLAPHAVRVRVVTNSGVWYTRESDGTESYLIQDPTDWDWDGDPDSWSRFWVIIYPADAWVEETDWGTSGETWGDDGETWGTTATPEHVRTIQGLVATWKPKHATCVSIIVAFDDASFDPESASETSSTWKHWGTGDPRVASRLDTARYWDGMS